MSSNNTPALAISQKTFLSVAKAHDEAQANIDPKNKKYLQQNGQFYQQNNDAAQEKFLADIGMDVNENLKQTFKFVEINLGESHKDMLGKKAFAVEFDFSDGTKDNAQVVFDKFVEHRQAFIKEQNQVAKSAELEVDAKLKNYLSQNKQVGFVGDRIPRHKDEKFSKNFNGDIEAVPISTAISDKSLPPSTDDFKHKGVINFDNSLMVMPGLGEREPHVYRPTPGSTFTMDDVAKGIGVFDAARKKNKETKALVESGELSGDYTKNDNPLDNAKKNKNTKDLILGADEESEKKKTNRKKLADEKDKPSQNILEAIAKIAENVIRAILKLILALLAMLLKTALKVAAYGVLQSKDGLAAIGKKGIHSYKKSSDGPNNNWDKSWDKNLQNISDRNAKFKGDLGTSIEKTAAGYYNSLKSEWKGNHAATPDMPEQKQENTKDEPKIDKKNENDSPKPEKNNPNNLVFEHIEPTPSKTGTRNVFDGESQGAGSTTPKTNYSTVPSPSGKDVVSLYGCEFAQFFERNSAVEFYDEKNDLITKGIVIGAFNAANKHTKEQVDVYLISDEKGTLSTVEQSENVTAVLARSDHQASIGDSRILNKAISEYQDDKYIIGARYNLSQEPETADNKTPLNISNLAVTKHEVDSDPARLVTLTSNRQPLNYFNYPPVKPVMHIHKLDSEYMLSTVHQRDFNEQPRQVDVILGELLSKNDTVKIIEQAPDSKLTPHQEYVVLGAKMMDERLYYAVQSNVTDGDPDRLYVEASNLALTGVDKGNTLLCAQGDISNLSTVDNVLNKTIDSIPYPDGIEPKKSDICNIALTQNTGTTLHAASTQPSTAHLFEDSSHLFLTSEDLDVVYADSKGVKHRILGMVDHSDEKLERMAVIHPLEFNLLGAIKKTSLSELRQNDALTIVPLSSLTNTGQTIKTGFGSDKITREYSQQRHAVFESQIESPALQAKEITSGLSQGFSQIDSIPSSLLNNAQYQQQEPEPSQRGYKRADEVVIDVDFVDVTKDSMDKYAANPADDRPAPATPNEQPVDPIHSIITTLKAAGANCITPQAAFVDADKFENNNLDDAHIIAKYAALGAMIDEVTLTSSNEFDKNRILKDLSTVSHADLTNISMINDAIPNPANQSTASLAVVSGFNDLVDKVGAINATPSQQSEYLELAEIEKKTVFDYRNETMMSPSLNATNAPKNTAYALQEKIDVLPNAVQEVKIETSMLAEYAARQDETYNDLFAAQHSILKQEPALLDVAKRHDSTISMTSSAGVTGDLVAINKLTALADANSGISAYEKTVITTFLSDIDNGGKYNPIMAEIKELQEAYQEQQTIKSKSFVIAIDALNANGGIDTANANHIKDAAKEMASVDSMKSQQVNDIGSASSAIIYDKTIVDGAIMKLDHSQEIHAKQPIVTPEKVKKSNPDDVENTTSIDYN